MLEGIILGSMLASQISRARVRLIDSPRLKRYIGQDGAVNHTDLETQGVIDILDSPGKFW